MKSAHPAANPFRDSWSAFSRSSSEIFNSATAHKWMAKEEPAADDGEPRGGQKAAWNGVSTILYGKSKEPPSHMSITRNFMDWFFMKCIV